jgi:hypothetical protein
MTQLGMALTCSEVAEVGFVPFATREVLSYVIVQGTDLDVLG